MMKVEPIRDQKKISQIKNILHDEGNFRDFLLFTCGINFGLRISDLLSLKISDVFDSDGDINEYFEICEKKTGKWNKIGIGEKVKTALKEYIKMYPFLLEDCENYLFFAKKTYPLGSKSIGRNQSYKLINQWCLDVGLKGRYGCHSMRKTLGFTAFRNSIPLEIISNRLNHSSSFVTATYLGITREETMEAFLKLDV